MSETDYFNLKLLYFLITYGKTKQKKTNQPPTTKNLQFSFTGSFLTSIFVLLRVKMVSQDLRVTWALRVIG